MTEAQQGAAAAPGGASTAGAMLRAARQSQGMHIAVLAAAIKVSPRKLEALEADRYDELPDATFTRALAQTVCRTLKIDAAPVLALLPSAGTHRLEQVAEGINAPFRERPARSINQPVRDWSALASPAIWAPAIVLLLAAALFLLPPGAIDWQMAAPPASAPASAVLAASAPASEPPAVAPAASGVAAAEPAAPPASAMVETVALAPQTPGEAASAPPAAPVAGSLVLRTSAESWIEVVDAGGTTLLSRVVQPGESVGLDGAMPLKLKVGNAAATQVVFRGKPLDLAAATRDNVARLELK